MTYQDQRCDNCRFWGAPLGEYFDNHWCKRYPPKLTNENGNGGEWPLISKDDWCGEWEARKVGKSTDDRAG